MSARRAARSPSRRRGPSFKVGDRVRFDHGFTRRSGVVIEDRGPLGVGGTWVYTIRMPVPYSDDFVFELPEDLLEAVKPRRARRSA